MQPSPDGESASVASGFKKLKTKFVEHLSSEESIKLKYQMRHAETAAYANPFDTRITTPKKEKLGHNRRFCQVKFYCVSQLDLV